MLTNEERVLGCLYGIGVGDALGTPSSFLTPGQIREKYGWIDSFITPAADHIFHGGLKAGEYTDDTEQSLAILHSYLRYRKVVPEDIVKEILGWAKRVANKYASPLGPSTERALKAIESGKVDIRESGRLSNTNGSSMRIAPIGIIHGLKGSSMENLLEDVYLTSFPTHNTTVCISAANAIAYGVSLCVQGEQDIGKIVQGTMEAADAGAKKGYAIVGPSISRRIELIYELVLKYQEPKEVMEKVWDYFGGGDLAGDSVPVAVGLFALGKGDPKKVIEYCVNFGGDCDTNGSMAGAMAGAYAGASAIPNDWKVGMAQANHVDFEAYAKQILEVVPLWNEK